VKTVVFAYHEIGYICLEELLHFGAEVLCLFTHEDDPGEEIWFRRPAMIARERGIPVYTPESLKQGGWIDLIEDLKPDIIFSFYYRKMIPIEVLEIPRIGAFNLHGSLLPKFRGRCPVNWVLIEGEKQTGLTLHYMLAKPDAGDIIVSNTVEITFEDNAYTLYLKMADAAKTVMKEILPGLEDGTFVRMPQIGPSSYYGGRTPEDGFISWDKDAVSIYNLIRATTHPYPGAFTYLDGRKLFIWKGYPEESVFGGEPGKIISGKPLRVQTGKGALRLLVVQFEGEEEMEGEAFATHYPLEGRKAGGKN
jgi:methionyl-tRNA formyltransferase